MERERFDALARLLATSGSRRGALSALFGVALLGHSPEAATKRKKGKGRGQGRRQEPGQGRGDRSPQDRLTAEGRGKGRKRRKKSRRRDQDQDPADGGGSANERCCGTTRCPAPEPGGTRSECDYAGQSFAGQDLNGSTFRGFDGRGANFDNTDTHGSVFAEACLQGASFRGANLEGSTWGDACLLDADFAGADLGGDSATFDGAVFCHTVMPDGRVNDRDCGTLPGCCRVQLGAGEACAVAGDCRNEPCQTKACVAGTCVYTAVANGPSPNARCATRCCSGTCCPPDATACNLEDLCCVPNCAGRDCGPDGCGRGGACGACPAGQVCEEVSGQCLCTAQSCPDGCCAGNRRCQPGDSNQFCGAGGEPCATCTGQDRCRDGTCTCVLDCQGKTCGPDGCGGSCGACPPHASCNGAGTACTCDVVRCDGACCAPGQVCDQEACCTPEPPATTCPEDTCGEVTNNCGQRVDCGPCQQIVCATGTCHDHRCTYALDPSGQPGTLCPAPRVCCTARCCPANQVCDVSGPISVCCTPEPDATTCHPPGGPPRCGMVPNNCGQDVDCGACEQVACQTGTCSADDHRCHYTSDPDHTSCVLAGGGAGICRGGQCVVNACRTLADCFLGTANACTDGICVCGGGPACDFFEDEECCGTAPGGTCVDVETDPRNCGGCEFVCPPGICGVPTCTHQVCGTAPAPDNTNPGGLCGDSEVCCGGACELIDAPQNCGTCGHVCPEPSSPCQFATCNNRVCGSENWPNGAPGGSCATGQCCDGICCTNPFPVCGVPGICETCTQHTQCPSGHNCCAGQCVEACCPIGNPCDRTAQCCSGNCTDVIFGGVCCLADGSTCTSFDECCSMRCVRTCLGPEE